MRSTRYPVILIFPFGPRSYAAIPMLNSDSIDWHHAITNLTTQELTFVQSQLIPRSFSPGQPIFTQGDTAQEAFLLSQGRMRLGFYNSTGQMFTTGVWGAGYIIGLISSYLGEPRFIAATAIDEVSATALPRVHLLACMRAIPQFALNISSLLARQASDSIKRSALLALDSFPMRLCRVLLRISTSISHADPPSDSAIIVGLSQQDLADMVGASRASVNHYLSLWSNAGLLNPSYSRIKIPSVSALSLAVLGEVSTI